MGKPRTGPAKQSKKTSGGNSIPIISGLWGFLQQPAPGFGEEYVNQGANALANAPHNLASGILSGAGKGIAEGISFGVRAIFLDAKGNLKSNAVEWIIGIAMLFVLIGSARKLGSGGGS